jgi:hypothetical protein
MIESVSVGGRNFICKFTDRAVRVCWRVSTRVQGGAAVASSGSTRISCLMKRFDCTRACKYLGGPTDPETAAG